jgi:hypothetical protein
MKLFVVLLLIGCTCQAQQLEKPQAKPVPKWKIDKNKLITGGLVLVAGSAKGFNETLVFHYKVFKARFPNANHEWFDPRLSWKNKYEDKNPDLGPKFPLSTSALIFVTDQYHLNQFIGRSAFLAAIVIKIGEKKRPAKHYLYDVLYYSACYTAGFAITYYPFSSWAKNKP